MKSKIVLLLLTLTGLTSTLHAQQTLVDRIKEAGHDWILGEWTATDENGGTLTQVFSPDLEGQAVNCLIKTPRWSIKAMTGLNPQNDEVAYVGFSSRGGAVLGKWDEHEGWPLLKLTAVRQDGNTWKGAVVYRKSGASSMKVEVYELDSRDEMSSEPQMSFTYRRK